MHIAQQILSEMANQNLEKVNFWCVDEGVLPIWPPLIPIYGVMHEKDGHFLIVNPFTHTLESSVWC